MGRKKMKKVICLSNFLILFMTICFCFSSCKNQLDELKETEEDSSTDDVHEIIKINAENPIIISHPVSAKAIVPATCTFTIGAYTKDNGTLTFQWYYIVDESEDSEIPIEDATESSYTATANTPSKVGYYCKITNTIEDNKDGGIKSSSTTTDIAWLEAVNLCEVLDSPVFVKQPQTTCVSQGESAFFSCTAIIDNYNTVYRWFETDSTGENKTNLSKGWSSSSELKIDPFSEKAVRYFVCAALPYVPSGENIPDNTVYSNVVGAAYTGLPILYLDTGDTATAEITKETYIPTEFKMKMSDGSEIIHSLSKKGIKGRGNSTWSFPKKGYNLNFDDKVSFFNLPESKKWCLIANYADRSLVRNNFASLLGNDIYNSEPWNPHFNFIELIMNGEYLGNYIFCEKISIDDERVNIQDISDCTTKKISNGKYIDKNNDNTIDIKDGGFILEIDLRKDADYWFNTEKQVCITLKEPDVNASEDEDVDTKKQIKNIVQNAENVLFSESFSDEESGWRKYIDENSVIDWYILNELGKNVDSGTEFITSVYLYYNPGEEKLHFGPIWDFDISFGNAAFSNNSNSTICTDYNEWYVKDVIWISRMFEDENFITNLKNRWNSKKNELVYSRNNNIQSISDEISVSASLNFFKWPVLGVWHIKDWPGIPGYKTRVTYQSEVDYLIDWCNSRYSWMDSAINSL